MSGRLFDTKSEIGITTLPIKKKQPGVFMNALLSFLEEIKADRDLFAQIENIDSMEDFVSLGQSRGFAFSIRDVEKEMNGEGELKAANLNSAFDSDLEEIGTGFSTCPCDWND